VLIFGAVFGIINLVKYHRAVAYSGDTYIDEGEMNYLSSYYKQLFSRELRISEGVNPDITGFWEKTDKWGVIYGDRLKAGFKEYVTGVLTAAAIYDSAISFSGAEKENYNRICDDMLLYLAGSDEKKFNEATAEFGFDWDDFRSANILLYKAQRAKSALYGEDGSKLILDSTSCNEYLRTYTRVDLLFIRLEDKFVLDDDGNFTYDDEYNVITEPLTEAEITERQALISTLNGYIANEDMSPETFFHYQKSSDGDKDMYSIGYYFNPLSEATAEFKSEFSEIVDKAYSMDIGKYEMVECPAIKGVCFIYRTDVIDGAYANDMNPFFSDFYSDAATYLYPITLKNLRVEVTFKDNFNANTILTQPKNNKYYVRSFDQ
jgi:hypothetical protein